VVSYLYNALQLIEGVADMQVTVSNKFKHILQDAQAKRELREVLTSGKPGQIKVAGTTYRVYSLDELKSAKSTNE
jgi:hypothetical protein